uniref:Secreted protein n=1 Tax=Steinernema glaseri TaxID=37863 RepID=A0A1I7ZAY9_9BILA
MKLSQFLRCFGSLPEGFKTSKIPGTFSRLITDTYLLPTTFANPTTAHESFCTLLNQYIGDGTTKIVLSDPYVQNADCKTREKQYKRTRTFIRYNYLLTGFLSSCALLAPGCQTYEINSKFPLAEFRVPEIRAILNPKGDREVNLKSYGLLDMHCRFLMIYRTDALGNPIMYHIGLGKGLALFDVDLALVGKPVQEEEKAGPEEESKAVLGIGHSRFSVTEYEIGEESSPIVTP